jgi:hypothetical protein
MKNFGMDEPEQYMSGKGRPRQGARISTTACQLQCHVEPFGFAQDRLSETSLAIAPFAESKMPLRFFASLRMTMCYLFCVAPGFANP